MKKITSLFIIGASAALPLMAMARTYNTAHLPYSDSPDDRATQVAISVLTEDEILEGNPDGTFRPNNALNRAEFMQIAIRLLPDGSVTMNRPCFPDVPTNVWYSLAVCRAKASGIVRGNAIAGVPESEWRFEPNRPVKYEEAVKVLVGIYSLPTGKEETGVDMQWYEPFINAAKAEMLTLSGVRVGENITRGEMARLVANFYANSHGELDMLHDAQEESSSSSSRSSSSSSRSSSRSSSSSSRQTTGSGAIDPISNTSVRGAPILLGETSGVLAAAKIFSNSEPINVESFYIELMDPNSSISSFLVYSSDKELLGRATLDTSVAGNLRYRLNVKNSGIQIPQKKEYSFYVRAETRDPNEGGVNGVNIQVDSLGVIGKGEWSGESYTQATTETFPISQTADAVITGITNAGSENNPLVAGPSRILGEFNITGMKGDTSANLRVTGLAFYLSTSGGVTVTNPQLRVAGSSDAHNCTLSSNVITCSTIPESFGSVQNNTPLKITLYGDITIPSNTSSASLQLTLIEPGTANSAGAVTWTDGTATYTWIAGESPVARGTYYSF